MIVEPERYVDDFREAGCDRITFHLEATYHAQRLLVHLRSMGVKAGIAICPQTPVGLLQDVIEDCDTVLVMSVNPGFSGQKFIPHAIEKVREARALIDGRKPECLIEVDGGVGETNARALVEAGADALVMGSTVFGAPDPAAALRHIRSLLGVTEDEIVARIEALLSRGRRGDAQRRVLLGIGDDAALWQPSRSHRSVISTDMLVEGVHFTREAMSLEDAGWRAMAANLSDLAAMGARPVLATVALGVCAKERRRRCAGALSGHRAGGGSLRHRHRRRRPHAQRGDDGLDCRRGRGSALERQDAFGRPLQRRARGYRRTRAPHGPGSKARATRFEAFRRPQARLAEGRFLAGSANVSAMMDCSDGLSTDVYRLCAASGCGAAIENVPVAAAARAFAQAKGEDAERFALAGGEDFELLAAIRPRAFGYLAGRFAKRFGRPLLRVGVLEKEEGVRRRGRPLERSGWEHFEEEGR